jgi:ligand-binding sensor domain-containing protein
MANRTGSGLPSTNVTGLIKDRQNRLWAGTAKGLALFQGASWRAFRFNGLGGNNCNYVAVETDGTPWVSHLTAGVSRRLDGAWQTFNQGSNGDTINNVTTIGCDPNGDVWLGTWGYGVTRRTREGSWRHYGSPPLPTPVVNVILPARSNGIYFSHWSNDYNDLLSRWDYADSTWHVIWGPNYDFRPLCLAFGDDGKLWVGTYGKPNYNGVYRQALDGKWDNWTTMNSGLPSNKVNALAIDNGGWVWAGTDNGLARYAGAAFLPVPNPDLGSKITAITVDRENNKWIGTDRGLFLLTWDGWWFVYNQRDAYGTGSRLLSDNVSFIAAAPRDASGDDIYVATDRGLNIIRCRASGDQSADQPVVAPNPLTMASGTPVMLSRLPDRAAVRVYTLDGRLIASATGPAAPAHQLFLRFGAELPKDLPSGIYLIHITAAAGPTSTLKLVILR